MQENLLGPLGTRSMSFQPADFADEEKAVVAVRAETDGTLGLQTEHVASEDDIDGGGSGLYGSAADYATFLWAVL